MYARVNIEGEVQQLVKIVNVEACLQKAFAYLYSNAQRYSSLLESLF